MKNKKIIIIVFLTVLTVLAITAIFYSSKGRLPERLGSAVKAVYYCAMHPDFTSDRPGNCMICGMTMIKGEGTPKQPKTAKAERKILFYRNPMRPESTSPVPKKDEMGMDYIPVYAEEAGAEAAGIYISPEKQQLIGIQKEKVEQRKLVRDIVTAGRIAYDPELYVAQEEYLQALKMLKSTQSSVLASIVEQSNSLLSAAEKKLLLLGMSKEEIDELAKRGEAQENLYLPLSSDSVWVYLAIYEYEIGLIKDGMPVEVDVLAFPGETFQGKVVAIAPVLNPETRSAQVRVEIEDPEHKLKPDMFVNAKISVDLGERLAVPEEAVMDTGERQIVFVAKENGYFQSREVKLGNKGAGYYEVLSGLTEGEEVVSSGNFFVDSESKLKSVVSTEQHQHKQ